MVAGIGLAGGLSMVALLGARTSVQEAQPPVRATAAEPTIAVPAWRQTRPFTIPELLAQTQGVVLAEATGVRDVPDIPGDSPSEPALPVEHVDFKTLDVIRGSAPETFTIFRTSSPAFQIEGDPPYEVGKRYVLFLNPREDAAGEFDGTYLDNLPDGRFQVTPDGLVPSPETPITRQLRGLSVKELRARLN